MHAAAYVGVYQIGDVHARSWIVAGTSSSSGRSSWTGGPPLEPPVRLLMLSLGFAVTLRDRRLWRPVTAPSSPSAS